MRPPPFRKSTASFRHGMRVRMGGVNGPRGVLLECTKRDGVGKYWKVRLQSGAWVWPDDLVVDGQGDRVDVCAQCDLPFVSDGQESICRRCDEDTFGTRARATEPAEDPVARRNWIRTHRADRFPLPSERKRTP